MTAQNLHLKIYSNLLDEIEKLVQILSKDSDIKEIDDFDSESKYRIRDKVKKEFYSNWDYNDVTNCRIIQAKYHENTYVDCEKARTTLLDIQILDFDSYEEASRFKNGNL